MFMMEELLRKHENNVIGNVAIKIAKCILSLKKGK